MPNNPWPDRLTRTKTVILTGIVIATLILSAAAVSGSFGVRDATAAQANSPTLKIESTTTTVGNTTTVMLTLSRAPNGLSGYDIQVQIGNSDVADITGSSYPDAFGLTDTNISADNSSVDVSAVDIQKNIQSGATNIPLATIELTGHNSGPSKIRVVDTNIDDDSGNNINPTVVAGTVTVRPSTTQTATNRSTEPVTKTVTGTTEGVDKELLDPNDNRSTAERVSKGQHVEGAVGRYFPNESAVNSTPDIDVYVFNATVGQTITINASVGLVGVELSNANGTVLDRQAGGESTGSGSFNLTATANKTGRYYVTFSLFASYVSTTTAALEPYSFVYSTTAAPSGNGNGVGAGNVTPTNVTPTRNVTLTNVTPAQNKTAYYQVDFVATDPIKNLRGPEGTYADSHLIRFVHGSTDEPVMRRMPGVLAYAKNNELNESIESHEITVENGTATITFTVAERSEPVELSLVSYEKPGPGWSPETEHLQEFVDADTGTFDPGTYMLTVDLPDEETNSTD